MDGNMTHSLFTGVNLGGCIFTHIGLPPGAKGKQAPVQFNNCDLNSSIMSQCDLTNVNMESCKVDGLMINGIPLKDMMKAYENSQKDQMTS